jgi:hypothetical protein
MSVASSIDFRPGAKRAQVLVTEIGVARARRHDQEIVAVGGGLPRENAPRRGIDAGDLVEQHLDVAVRPQHRSDRLCDVGRRQRCRGDLVQERLEQMVVAPVDYRHRHGRPAEPLGGREAGEAGADDHDLRRPPGRDPGLVHTKRAGAGAPGAHGPRRPIANAFGSRAIASFDAAIHRRPPAPGRALRASAVRRRNVENRAGAGGRVLVRALS